MRCDGGVARLRHHIVCMNSADQSRAAPCPICGKDAAARFRPFCSARCADVDLNRWLSGVYAVPGRDDEAADEKPSVPKTNDDAT
jgi:endogenous inhibitor of DNA gyrase (YacG/DUF329 family)